jgi:6-phosphogluconolactonase
MALLTIASDEPSLAERVATRFVEVGAESAGVRSAAICLTGGNTPRRMYELLATPPWQARLPWEGVHVYWSDERHVPPDHRDSNYGMAHEALLKHVPLPTSHVHRIEGELNPEEAARSYERELPARFDLMLLGMGEDAHIASIFPGSALVSETRRGVAAVWAPHLNAYRITLTPTALLDSDRILVMVSGAAKAPAVAAALEHPTDPARYPVHLLRAAGNRVEWFIDRAAARDVASRPG